MSMMSEFKEFAVKGNVLDMAVGVIIGGAFGKIVSSVVSDILMPPIGLLMGKVDFSSLFIPLTEDAKGNRWPQPKPPVLPPSTTASSCKPCSILRFWPSSFSW